MEDPLGEISSPSDDDSNHLRIMTNSHEVNRYETKYKRFKKIIKDTIFENAALCDEVARVNDQIIKVKEERRFLLKKVFHLQSLHEPHSGPQGGPKVVHNNAAPNVGQVSTTKLSGSTETHSAEAIGSLSSNKKRKVTPKKSAKDIIADASVKAINKRKRSGMTTKRHAQLVPLDASGRPIFPIDLGSVTVHSLGEIATDRLTFHSEDYIYPIGFCSTRMYASTKNPDVKCLYTCKISDDGTAPKFEIAADDDPENPFAGSSAGICHTKLLKAVNAHIQINESMSSDRGAKFFGFSHPTIQNLIQGCPGARKCVNYKWVKFEVCKLDQMSDVAYCMSDSDATISFEALQRSLHPSSSANSSSGAMSSYESTPKTMASQQHNGESPNLRILLTNKSSPLPTPHFSS